MTLDDMMALCSGYSNLGCAVQEQLDAVINGEPLEEQNANALRMVANFLKVAESVDVEGAADLRKQIDVYLNTEPPNYMPPEPAPGEPLF